MKYFIRIASLCCLIIFAVSCNKDNSEPADTGTNPDSVKIVISGVTDMGALSMPQHLAGRDGGQSALIGTEVRWIFGDSFFDQRSVDNQQYRTNTSCVSTVANPLITSEPLDAKGVSAQFIPYTAQEKYFNDSANDPGNRIAIWPTGVITTSNTTALVFYTKLHIQPGTWQDFGIGIAHYTLGQSAAVRNPDLLFHNPEMNYENPFVFENYLYLAAQNLSGTRLTRAPLAQAEQRTAYQFWNGSSWVNDINAAKSVFSYGDGNVRYNPHFKMLTRIYSPGFSNDVYIQLANKPQGPWSQPRLIYKTPPPASGNNYIIFNHTELGSTDGKSVVLSYSHPLPAFLAGEIRLVKIDFE